jgi:hypothetical protein
VFLQSGYKVLLALRVSRLPRASAASDGGTILIGAGKLSRYRIFIKGTGPAEAGVQAVSEPGICHGAGFILWANARFDSRSFSEGWCPGARTITYLSWVQELSKNRDKQLTHIVRVMRSCYYSFRLCLLEVCIMVY